MDIITYALLKAKLAKKADLDSPHFTGEPTAPTPDLADDSTRLATTEFVQDLVESADKIYYNTTAGWAEQTTLISERGAIYIWSDYRQNDNTDIPGIKIGDGLAYVLDLPFIDADLVEHIQDIDIHVSLEEKAFWNDKVRCFIDANENETLVFTTD